MLRDSLIAQAIHGGYQRHTESDGDEDEKATPLRILLEGPSSCGKTSLAMDFAFHLISNLRGGKGVTETPRSCDSCAVLFLVPETKKQDRLFPMKCQEFKGSHKRAGPFQWTVQDYPILHVIKVKYVKSLSDLIYTLATIHLLPRSTRPTSAVIIDDLDIFLQKDTATQDSNSNRTTDIMKLLQLCTYNACFFLGIFFSFASAQL